jgi:hypothetical protein
MLEKEPIGRYSDTQYYKTESQILAALTASYAPASFSNDENILWVYGDVVCDDATKGGVSSDKKFITDFELSEIYSDNDGLIQIWSIYYNGITQANIVISKLNEPDISAELRTRIEGEAYFLRAYYYFVLTNIFRDLPLLTKVYAPSDLQIPASPQSAIWAQIESDCNTAITRLPAKYSAGDLGRATQGAARALLAKTYLYQKEYQLCLDEIDIIETLGYDLMPIYSHNYKMQYDNNIESIWEIQHLGGQDPHIGSTLTQTCLPRDLEGWGFNVPTQDFVDEFEEVGGIYDPRLFYTVAGAGGAGEKWIDGTTDFNPGWSTTGYVQKKYVQPSSELSNTNDGDLNYKNIRYADVLLWKAESLNELGRTADASIPLNTVRKRARESFLYDESLAGYGTIPVGLLADIDVTDQVAMRTAIKHERRVELGFEMQRRFDLVRWGDLISTMESYAAKYGKNGKGGGIESKHNYFPIPFIELQLNSNLKQNSDY